MTVRDQRGRRFELWRQVSPLPHFFITFTNTYLRMAAIANVFNYMSSSKELCLMQPGTTSLLLRRCALPGELFKTGIITFAWVDTLLHSNRSFFSVPCYKWAAPCTSLLTFCPDGRAHTNERPIRHNTELTVWRPIEITTTSKDLGWSRNGRTNIPTGPPTRLRRTEHRVL